MICWGCKKCGVFGHVAGSCAIARSNDDRRKKPLPVKRIDALLADYKKREELIGQQEELKQFIKMGVAVCLLYVNLHAGDPNHLGTADSK